MTLSNFFFYPQIQENVSFPHSEASAVPTTSLHMNAEKCESNFNGIAKKMDKNTE